MQHRNKSMVETFYLRYQKLAENYANQIFNFERYGYERQDIVQELRIKIYMSVIGYAKKWALYKRTGKLKPVPIQYYIQSSLSNRTKDFIKTFNQDSVENVDKLSLQSNSFDYGIHTTMDSKIELSKCVCEINGVNLFNGLTKNEQRCFSLYLKGYTVARLKTLFKKLPIDVESIINNQTIYLQERKADLYDFYTDTFKVYNFAEEEMM